MSAHTPDPGVRASGDRVRVWAAVVLAGLAVTLSLVGLAFAVLLGSEALHPFVTAAITFGLSFGVVGGIVAARVPRNAIGWLFLLVALSQSSNSAAGGYVEVSVARGWDLPGLAFIAWTSSWTWAPGFIAVLTLVPLLFPTGRLPSSRWWPAACLAVVAMFATVVITAVLAWPDPFYALQIDATFDGPWVSVLEAAVIAVGLSALASVVAVIVRYRSAGTAERQQMRWFLFAALIGSAVLYGVGMLGSEGAADVVLALLAPLVLSLIPVAVGVAMLRYRLYEIDRIISRTVLYGAVVAVLTGVYALGVVVLGRVLSPLGAGNDLTVAASTLAVAALFRPLVTRLRTAVDRRFDRRRYDARSTVERFVQRLRDEVDGDRIRSELRVLVSTTLSPTHVDVWIPHRKGGTR